MKGSQKKGMEKRSFPFMGERNSRRRKGKNIIFRYVVAAADSEFQRCALTLGNIALVKKKFVVLRRRYMAFPKLERVFSLFENAGKARFVLSFLFTAFSHASEEEEEEEEGKGGRLYIFYGMAERAMVSRRGGVWRRFYLFFSVYTVGFFFVPGNPVTASSVLFFFANGRRRTVRCIRWLRGEKWRSERKSGETGVFYY